MSKYNGEYNDELVDVKVRAVKNLFLKVNESILENIIKLF